MVTLHIFSMMFSFGVIWKADKDALAWLRGKREVLDASRLRLHHTLMWLGLAALIVTGSILSYPMLGYLLSQPLFIMKLLFVAILIVNAVLIGRVMHVAHVRSFASLTWNERVPLLMSGVISSFAWLGALVLALALFK